MKPVQAVAINDNEYLHEHPEHPLHKCSLLLALEFKNEFDSQQDNDSTRVRTPYTFLRDYIKRLKRSEEHTITIEHINRPPPVTSQPIYTHITEHAQPKLPTQYGAYPLRTMNTGSF